MTTIEHLPATAWDLIYANLSYRDALNARSALFPLHQFLLAAPHVSHAKRLAHRYRSHAYRNYMKEVQANKRSLQAGISSRLADEYPDKCALVLLALEFGDVSTLKSVKRTINTESFVGAVQYAVKCTQIESSLYPNITNTLAMSGINPDLNVGTVSQRFHRLQRFLSTSHFSVDSKRQIETANEFTDHVKQLIVKLFAKACKYDIENIVQQILQFGIDITRWQGDPLLSFTSRLSTFRLLIDHGLLNYDVHESVLAAAAKNGDKFIVELLLHRGADIHARNDFALQMAAQNGNLEMIALLLDRGANIHADNDVVLRIAANRIRGNGEFIEFLLDRGASIHAGNDVALQCAAREGNSACVKLLLERGAHVHADNDYALRHASIGGHLDCIRLLLEYGADVHALNDEALQRTSLYNNNVEIVKLLLDNGANIHANNDHALFSASCSKHFDVVQLLVERGANIRSNRNFALQMAAEYGCLAAVKQQLQQPSKIGLYNFYDSFSSAAGNGQTEVVNYMIERGIDVNFDDCVTLRKAAGAGKIQIVKCLLDKGADIHACGNYALQIASKNGHIETVRLLLDRGANIHAQNDRSLTLACEKSEFEMAKMLIERGANIHAANDYALVRAISFGNYKCVKLLLDHGADIHANKDSALRKPAKFGRIDIVQLLLENGADIHANMDGALCEALENKYSNVAEVLLQNGAIRRQDYGWLARLKNLLCCCFRK